MKGRIPIRKNNKFSWLPKKRQYYKGDTIFDTLSQVKYFMPESEYFPVRARNEEGSLEWRYVGDSLKGKYVGEDIDDGIKFEQYQSVMKNCRMILTEKTNKIIQNRMLICLKELDNTLEGMPRVYGWIYYMGRNSDDVRGYLYDVKD